MLDFLLAFPSHTSIQRLVCAEETPVDKIFPPSAPYKILYSIYTLKQCCLSRTPYVIKFISTPDFSNIDQVPSDRNLTIHCIRSLTAALTTINFSIGPERAEADITVALHLLECLLCFLKGIILEATIFIQS